MVRPDKKQLGNSGEMSKAEAEGWTICGHTGKSEDIDKNALSIDFSYQRDTTQLQRISYIAQNFNWWAFHRLIVVRRKDGTIKIVDGQHRWLASLKHDKIKKVPCIVVGCETVEEEANLFLILNGMRGPMRAWDRFKAMLSYKAPSAVVIAELAKKHGCEIAKYKGQRKIACVSALLNEFNRDQYLGTSILPAVFGLVLKAANQEFPEILFAALCKLERFLNRNRMSIFEKQNLESLLRFDYETIYSHMRKSHDYHRKGGAAVDAQGIVNLMNQRRRVNHLPNIMSSTPGKEHGED